MAVVVIKSNGKQQQGWVTCITIEAELSKTTFPVVGCLSLTRHLEKNRLFYANIAHKKYAVEAKSKLYTRLNKRHFVAVECRICSLKVLSSWETLLNPNL
jgi:hypothetical protein